MRATARGWTAIEVIGVLVAFAVAVTAIVAGVRYVGSWIERHDEGMRKAGYDAADAAYKAQIAAQAKRVAAEIARIEKQRDDIAEAALHDLSIMERHYAKKSAEKDAVFDRFIANVRAGRIVLRDPGTRDRACGAGDRPGSSTAIASASGSGDGGDRGGVVSGQAAEFLLGEARRGDQMIERLRLCRAYIATLRSAIERGDAIAN